jgi:hypothetical protein
MQLGSRTRFAKQHAEAKDAFLANGDVSQLSLFMFRKAMRSPPADPFAATTFWRDQHVERI